MARKHKPRTQLVHEKGHVRDTYTLKQLRQEVNKLEYHLRKWKTQRWAATRELHKLEEKRERLRKLRKYFDSQQVGVEIRCLRGDIEELVKTISLHSSSLDVKKGALHRLRAQEKHIHPDPSKEIQRQNKDKLGIGFTWHQLSSSVTPPLFT